MTGSRRAFPGGVRAARPP